MCVGLVPCGGVIDVRVSLSPAHASEQRASSQSSTLPFHRSYIGGEGPLGGTPAGYVAEVAQTHKACIVALEHRWYGASIPGDVTSTADLGSLNVANAIADLAAFVTWYDAQLAAALPAENVTTARGSAVTHTWLAIGGERSLEVCCGAGSRRGGASVCATAVRAPGYATPPSCAAPPLP